MAFVPVDLIVTDILHSAIEPMTNNPEMFNEVFSNFPDTYAEEIRDFLRQQNIPVVEGWPTQETAAPLMTVQLMPSSEPAELQTINADQEWLDGSMHYTEWGAYFATTVQITCYGNNQREATYLAYAVKALLLWVRHHLTSQGVVQQRIEIKDYEPVPSVTDPNTPWFMRIVTLSTLHRDTWIVTGEPVIAGFIANPYDEREGD